MPSLYAIAGLALALLLSNAGWYATHEHDKAQYKALQLEIATAHSQAVETANAHILRQESLNTQLEISHAQTVTTINAYRDQLRTTRLPGSGHCENTSTGQPANQTADTELPESLDGLVKSEFYRADQVAAYAEECYQYLNRGESSEP